MEESPLHVLSRAASLVERTSSDIEKRLSNSERDEMIRYKRAKLERERARELENDKVKKCAETQTSPPSYEAAVSSLTHRAPPAHASPFPTPNYEEAPLNLSMKKPVIISTPIPDSTKNTGHLDSEIDEHFRKSLGASYDQFRPSKKVEETEKASEDVDDHFARSLGNKWREEQTGDVDEHFARALGGATWKKIKQQKTVAS
ncbi:DgyrCDS13209 [Dimorphilus gyrociliatus]|uniref:DgyrCDS13209 n=1 Tax=Dimorphilus gyrociliatus TaxID=2664684 RepID=A0A7I8W9Z5_9ANNE|nr:DgyrCDS13209 [Dimorphilus gyrociliatus]